MPVDIPYGQFSEGENARAAVEKLMFGDSSSVAVAASPLLLLQKAMGSMLEPATGPTVGSPSEVNVLCPGMVLISLIKSGSSGLEGLSSKIFKVCKLLDSFKSIDSRKICAWFSA